MDLSQFSTEDLKALQVGDLAKVSTGGLKAMHTLKTRETIDNDPISKGARNFAQEPGIYGNSTLSNLAAGVGSGMASISRALGLSSQDSAEKRRLDAPLAATGAGKAGTILGNAAVAAPLMLVPGANTALGATVAGVGFGGATTEGDVGDRLVGAALGGAGGLGGVAIGKGLGMAAQKVAAGRATARTANAGKDVAAQNALQAGYTLPPTEVNPSGLNSLLEGLSGKIKTSQSASQKNQPITNTLAKRELGLPSDAPITLDALKTLRASAGQAYDAVGQAGVITPTPAYAQALDSITASAKTASAGFPGAKANPLIAEIESLKSPQFDASAAVAKIKSLRADADKAYVSGDKELGKALKSGAGALEDAIETHLMATGAPAELLQNFRNARTTIAKTYSVEKALNPTTGDVSASVLAAQLKRGKPLSNDLRTIAEAGQAFPKATQSLQQNYNAVSPLDYMTGAFGASATGNPLMLAAAAARPGVRGAILSQPLQRRLAPNYTPNQLLQILAEHRALPLAGMTLPVAAQ